MYSKVSTTISNNDQGRVEEYIRTNISTLSPQKEVLGGKFYVTSIKFQDNGGTVEYEDGHVAYSATFKYSVDPNGTVKVDDFTVLNPQ